MTLSQVGVSESSQSAMNTLAPELSALMTILRSVGPVISTRRSSKILRNGRGAPLGLANVRGSREGNPAARQHRVPAGASRAAVSSSCTRGREAPGERGDEIESFTRENRIRTRWAMRHGSRRPRMMATADVELNAVLRRCESWQRMDFCSAGYDNPARAARIAHARTTLSAKLPWRACVALLFNKPFRVLTQFTDRQSPDHKRRTTLRDFRRTVACIRRAVWTTTARVSCS